MNSDIYHTVPKDKKELVAAVQEDTHNDWSDDRRVIGDPNPIAWPLYLVAALTIAAAIYSQRPHVHQAAPVQIEAGSTNPVYHASQSHK